MSVIIIAEAGVNHNGDISLAKQLVREAKNAGADYIKFQTFKADNLATRQTKKAEYQTLTSDSGESQFEMLKRLELDEDMHKILNDECQTCDIKFLSTAFDIDSVHFLQSFNLDYFKIPSGDINNLPYLRAIASYHKPVIISTGMATMQEIEDCIEVFFSCGYHKEMITLLHCNTEYPTPIEDVNLKAMQKIKESFGTNIGYSDHSVGIEVPIAAVALGAKIIEKHFTLDRELSGPDHKASLIPEELNEMIKTIRNIELSLGDGIKKPSVSEQKNISVARKSIVAKKAIKKGELFTEENLTCKRPGTGISPMQWDEVIGKAASKDYYADDFITE